MKKSITLILVVISFNLFAQDYKPVNPDKNIGLFGGGYTSINIVDYLELGALAGINVKDISMIGLYYQRSIKNNDYYGFYCQFNINHKNNYVTLGLALRVGLVDSKYISLEPAFTIQTLVNDDIKIFHQIGITGGLPSYNIGLLFGNFGAKWYKN